MVRASKVCFFCLLILVAGCSGKKLSPEQYMRWVEDPSNGLSVEKKIGDFLFVAQHKPADYAVLKELHKRNATIDVQSFDSLKREFDGMEYYTLKIGGTKAEKDVLLYGARSEQEYFQRIQYLSAEAQKDIYLTRGTDTLPCALYHFERTYGVSPFNNLLIGFVKPVAATDETVRLHFNDQAFGNGLLIFTFSNNKIPQLVID